MVLYRCCVVTRSWRLLPVEPFQQLAQHRLDLRPREPRGERVARFLRERLVVGAA